MGSALPKAVDSTVVERHEKKGFRVGASELNGWRTNMEDAHVIHICDDWAFFGVFDGHGGDACANFVAPRMEKELKDKGCPKDDEAVRTMLFAIDDEFMKMSEEGGSTATMCLVHNPRDSGEKHKLRVINAGDSRVLLGKRNGAIVDGGGTDQGLTIDHKPDNPTERERIEAAGEQVIITFGNCARVSGNLAVSRGFGDRKYKTNWPDKAPEKSAVTVDPDLINIECDETDFIVLVCDGVSEGDFPNSQVIALIAKELEKSNDPGAAARAVCHKAVERNSKDNISCMVVLLDGSRDVEKTIEFRAGPVDKLDDQNYFEAYQAMAKRADLSVAEAVEIRYGMLDSIRSMLESDELSSSLSAEDIIDQFGSCPTTDDGKPCLKLLKEELELLGKVDDAVGSKERKDFFENWLSKTMSRESF